MKRWSPPARIAFASPCRRKATGTSAARTGSTILTCSRQKEIFDKIPTINIQQFQEVDGGPYPSSSAGPIYNLSDNLSWIKGNHTFKFGFLFERAGPERL